MHGWGGQLMVTALKVMPGHGVIAYFSKNHLKKVALALAFILTLSQLHNVVY